ELYRVRSDDEDNWHPWRCILQSEGGCRPSHRENDGRTPTNDFGCERGQIGLTAYPTIIECNVPPFCKAQFSQPFIKTGQEPRIVLARRGAYQGHERHRRLPRARRKRPRRSSAAEQRDELPALHSIASSARAMSCRGTSIPSARAVLRLMISSTLVTCWTGKSPGFSPLRIRPAYWPERRCDSVKFPP